VGKTPRPSAAPEKTRALFRSAIKLDLFENRGRVYAPDDESKSDFLIV
jgi:hypothetical protein